MRDLSNMELGQVYGAGSGGCWNPCGGGKHGSRGKSSKGRSTKCRSTKGKGSRGKRSRGRC